MSTYVVHIVTPLQGVCIGVHHMDERDPFLLVEQSGGRLVQMKNHFVSKCHGDLELVLNLHNTLCIGDGKNWHWR